MTVSLAKFVERGNDYPTGNADGMSFICNRWVFTGPDGYRVKPDGAAFRVVYYNAAGEKPCYGGQNLTEEEAHTFAARASGAVRRVQARQSR